MNKKIIMLCCGFFLLFLMACGSGKQPDSRGPFVYYLNTNGTGLVKEEYKPKSDKTENEIKRMLKKLKNPPESIDYQSPLPKEVEVEDFLLEKTVLQLYFSGTYSKMATVEEVLCRAAMVQTLCQISDVQFVEFHIGEDPLTDKDGKVIGLMRKDDFIQNMGSEINTYQAATLKLSFANKAGDKLVKETVNVRYNSNLSMEKLIVEKLMEGPSAEGESRTISTETKLLGVSIKEGICYVNFDGGFLENTIDLDPRITIYSIVNSIVDGGNVQLVQIAVNGESDITFKGSVKLDKPLGKNEELLEESK